LSAVSMISERVVALPMLDDDLYPQ
jgi:hypothetical protein